MSLPMRSSRNSRHNIISKQLSSAVQKTGKVLTLYSLPHLKLYSRLERQWLTLAGLKLVQLLTCKIQTKQTRINVAIFSENYSCHSVLIKQPIVYNNEFWGFRVLGFWICYMVCYMGNWICYIICYMGNWICYMIC